MPRYIKFLIVLVIIIFAVLAAKRIFGPHGGPGGMHMGAGSAPEVSVAEVISREVQQWNEFSGRLVAVNQAEIRPRVSGDIEGIHFKEGSLVKEGDLLFTIDPKPYQAEVSRAESAVASAEAELVLARTEAERAKRLFADKAIAKKEYDERINGLKVAEANIKAAHAGLEVAKLNLGYSKIKAPISGRIGRAEITLGNMVEAGANAPVLTTIVENDPIYADFEVDEQVFLTYLEKNATAAKDVKKIPVMMQLDKEGSVMQGGVIQSFDNRLNPVTGTIRVRAAFDNADGALIPGLFAKIMLGDAAKTNAILITERAIGTDQSKKFVFVVGADNKIAYREIKLGSSVDGLRVVTEGLKPGEKIVVNGLQRVRPGVEVKPETVLMYAPPMEAKPDEQAKSEPAKK